MSTLQEIVHGLPDAPGCYLMKDAEGRIIYIGKAKNLKKRVLQYLTRESQTRYQIAFLMKRVVGIDYMICHNEKEALLLENSLIKRHRPRYNIFLKDDKSYLSLKFNLQHDFPRLLATRHVRKDGATYYGPYASAEACRDTVEFVHRHFQLRSCTDRDFAQRTRPCLEYQIKRCTAPCVGYISKQDYRRQVEVVRLFLDGKNQDFIKMVESAMNEAAADEDFERAARLRDLWQNIDRTLEKQHVVQHGGNHQDLIYLHRLEQKGIVAVLNIRNGLLIDSHYYAVRGYDDNATFLGQFLGQYYAQHPFIPDEILVSEALYDQEVLEEWLTSVRGKKVRVRMPQKGEKRALLALAEKNARAQLSAKERHELTLQTALDETAKIFGVATKLVRIECYDVSNLFGTHATASMVVMLSGELDPSAYRHFSIKTVAGIDDYQMMAEVLSRRFGRLHDPDQRSSDPSFGERPDLLIMDGGKGQLNRTLQILKEMGLDDIPVVGMAKGRGRGARARGAWAGKKEEDFYLPNRKNPVKLKRGSEVLKLLQRLRDEAHRFAISHHRRKKMTSDTQSFLDGIRGLGAKRKQALYARFKSRSRMATCTLDELMGVKGINEPTAALILERARANGNK